MTCPGPERLAGLLDADLDPGAQAAVGAHAAGCARCQAELARLRAGIALLRQGSPAPEPSPFFAARLAARLAAEPPPAAGLGRLRALLAGRGLRLAALAGAAAVAIAVAGGVVSARRTQREALELAAAERLELYEELEVVAGLGDVESAEDAAVVAALDALDGGRRP